ncbi:alpha-glucuronidase family glycosyl hydrolase [Evansella cellulosilytica]|uniref:Xylan alpha-1,2-glucuronidase n=1 Tax=Evansella cellulosilytica (strain ATCC 21833 / DSM 2522 / FERM P-1141 / JCM 9156 / N-4) TaxID=649639 RepID=E6TXL6_EVAC2|nr:alpha-glucuronidase family glycosyl hydrolase [Evansella cellulosilytica]ADU28830.1 Alpha-glucuronidase [Evansella cellulosilytica DSM 2522]
MDRGYKMWLRYNQITNQEVLEEYQSCLQHLHFSVNTATILAAVDELQAGLSSMINHSLHVLKTKDQRATLLLTIEESIAKEENVQVEIEDEGYVIKSIKNNRLIIFGKTDIGVLYGVFHLLRLMQTQCSLKHIYIVEQPKNSLRMLNEWDNMDGSIERGYAGVSIFFENNQFTKDWERVKDYARLLASVGINGIAFNNVNVHEQETKLITPEYLPTVAKVANIFRMYGIKTFLSINYASPISLGGMDTADPLNEEVRQWWKDKAKEIYRFIPDFGGVLVKADSEHRPGPFTYNRTHADGANMLAGAFAPFDGIVLWRCFVYDCMQDWRDRSTDRARAAYDHFKPIDGKFHKNVVLQIKNGPMDFQVREAVSPLFGAMPNTNQMLELQITQEYTGQQKHLCYLVPQWKEILDFDTYANGVNTPIKSIVDGSQYKYDHCGITAVSNVGNDDNWTGHTLAQANLYGYARLAWNPDLSAELITDEWAKLTFGVDEQVVQVVSNMLLQSWHIYEKYTSPLGVGWMVNPGHHYGPNVDGYEYSVWGTYHFADSKGIGVDRTVATGTGFTNQYFKENKELYETLNNCPDELLLFFHHVPYTHQLKSGDTVIQHIYNTHFEGVEEAIGLKKSWLSLEAKISPSIFNGVSERLQHQIEHAKEWRDVINTYFYRKSGIEDEKNRKIY